MTSSLVGSEMCIRDSAVSVWTTTSSAVPVRAEEDPRSENSCLVWYLPVSYTHLTLPTICSV
eukprot:4407019-Prorocentrum_lima.AAC.1